MLVWLLVLLLLVLLSQPILQQECRFPHRHSRRLRFLLPNPIRPAPAQRLIRPSPAGHLRRESPRPTPAMRCLNLCRRRSSRQAMRSIDLSIFTSPLCTVGYCVFPTEDPRADPCWSARLWLLRVYPPASLQSPSCEEQGPSRIDSYNDCQRSSVSLTVSGSYFGVEHSSDVQLQLCC
jgi:hypothetical protein